QDENKKIIAYSAKNYINFEHKILTGQALPSFMRQFEMHPPLLSVSGLARFLVLAGFLCGSLWFSVSSLWNSV
ncbi:MAG: hypothetical protein LBQ64_02475, partial [Bacteroidales bacterium]|nr:hypothetical protein [Bacteroidales bacterium]